MEGMRDALLRLYRAARIAAKGDKAFAPDDSPYTHIKGNIVDAIYCLLGESGTELEKSTAFNTVEADYISEDLAVGILMTQFEMNNLQPVPRTFQPEEMRELYKKNGGYMTPEGEWK